jgi:hypothetical protein
MFLYVVRSRFLATTLLFGLGVSSAWAQDATWSGTTTEWTTPGNWSTAALPTGTAIFTGAGSATVANAGGSVTLGERRGAGGGSRTRDSIDRNQVAEWLVGGGNVRGRVLERHVLLRRQGCGAVRVVSVTISLRHGRA